ncbi:MAG TPA: dienelactone hydrolase family protein [Nitrososphaeraceae archaeon]|nr:dienelactone hydrolase family protein [Nitrososphaeraceae archaeon]
MKQLQLVLILVVVLTPLFILLEPLESAQAQHRTTTTTTTTTTTASIPTIMTISSVSNNINTSSNIQTIQNKTVNYYDSASGYLVYPVLNPNNNTQKLPAVVMIHEWWGLNDNIKDMAYMLAKEGYVVLAVDLYGEVATDPGRAMELSSSVRNNPEEAVANMQGAVNYLGSLENVNSSRIASLGWCFGGGQSLQLALNSEEHPLAATVIYYGNLVNDTESLSKIKWPVLGIFGDQDQSIPVDSVMQFEQALNEIGITNEIYIYPGVGHAFANPSGDNYAPKETADAWKKTLAFLEKYT